MHLMHGGRIPRATSDLEPAGSTTGCKMLITISIPCIFMGFGAQKTISSYSFDRIVQIFGYIVERINTKILSSHFLQFPSWTQIMTS